MKKLKTFKKKRLYVQIFTGKINYFTGWTGHSGRSHRGPYNPSHVRDIHFCPFKFILKDKKHPQSPNNLIFFPAQTLLYYFFLRCLKMYIHHNQNAERNPRLFSWSSVDGIFVHRRGLQSGGRRLCRRKRLRMCGLTSSFCSKRVIIK